MTEYYVIVETNLRTLIRSVTEELGNGWILSGGIHTAEEPVIGLVYMQAVYRATNRTIPAP